MPPLTGRGRCEGGSAPQVGFARSSPSRKPQPGEEQLNDKEGNKRGMKKTRETDAAAKDAIVSRKGLNEPGD